MIEIIKNHPVYKQIMKDSIGGLVYNVANCDKYDAGEIIAMWEAASPSEREAAGGIMKGAFNFLDGR